MSVQYLIKLWEEGDHGVHKQALYAGYLVQGTAVVKWVTNLRRKGIGIIDVAQDLDDWLKGRR